MSVLDTSALLAIVYGEPGRERVVARLADGVVSIVNAAETMGDLVNDGRSLPDAARIMAEFDLTWVVPDAGQAERVAELRTVHGLSLGDRFCIALAEARGEALVTADHQWAGLDLKVPVELIR